MLSPPSKTTSPPHLKPPKGRKPTSHNINWLFTEFTSLMTQRNRTRIPNLQASPHKNRVQQTPQTNPKPEPSTWNQILVWPNRDCTQKQPLETPRYSQAQTHPNIQSVPGHKLSTNEHRCSCTHLLKTIHATLPVAPLNATTCKATYNTSSISNSEMKSS